MTTKNIFVVAKQLAAQIATCASDLSGKNRTPSLLLQGTGNSSVEIEIMDVSNYLNKAIVRCAEALLTRNSFFMHNRQVLVEGIIHLKDLVSICGLQDSTPMYRSFDQILFEDTYSMEDLVRWVTMEHTSSAAQEHQYQTFIRLIHNKLTHLYNCVLYVLKKQRDLARLFRHYQAESFVTVSEWMQLPESNTTRVIILPPTSAAETMMNIVEMNQKRDQWKNPHQRYRAVEPVVLFDEPGSETEYDAEVPVLESRSAGNTQDTIRQLIPNLPAAHKPVQSKTQVISLASTQVQDDDTKGIRIQL